MLGTTRGRVNWTGLLGTNGMWNNVKCINIIDLNNCIFVSQGVKPFFRADIGCLVARPPTLAEYAVCEAGLKIGSPLNPRTIR